MSKVIMIVVVISGVYLGYKNFVEGSKAEKIALNAADVGKQTVDLGKDGLNGLNSTVKSHIK